MNFLTIAPLVEALLPEAVALDQRCLGGLWTEDGYRREIDSPNSDLLMAQTKAEQTQVIGLGCLWSILEEAHITILAIDPRYQRQGLGQALLLALLESAWKRGLEWATLEVRASNQAAIALYQRFDFQEVGRRRKYYDNSEDALILWRKGLQHPEFLQRLQQWRSEVEQRLERSGWQWSD
ncbi:ribosomal protein S18-alanine N-acetyltransferase [Phormidium tenue FACHB-886]|nr:ribosomal protein S18-alanine N-acetyltransferase [Phormidium tenue FACHB-886]